MEDLEIIMKTYKNYKHQKYQKFQTISEEFEANKVD